MQRGRALASACLLASAVVTTGADVAADRALRGCPDKPNCVSSAEAQGSRRVEPFVIAGDAAEQWPKVIEAVLGLPRTQIVDKTDNYIHAESRSRIFGFVDDLELVLEASTGVVGVRSASRIGYSDLGVNRKRVERLREALLESGTIRGI